MNNFSFVQVLTYCLATIMAKFNVPTNVAVEKNPAHNYGRIKIK